MKQIFLGCLLCFSHLFLFAQTRSTEVDYQKQSRPALVNDVPFPSATIEKAIEDTFSKMGYKSINSKGYTVYKGVRLPQLGTDSYDVYFMVDKKSRKDKENSTVTMMVTKGFDAFVSRSSDAAVFERSQTYLDSLRNMIAIYDLEQQITAQQEEVKKADKKSADLEDEAKSLEKKKRKLEEDISDNDKARNNQEKEIEKQKQILEVLKGKRK